MNIFYSWKETGCLWCVFVLLVLFCLTFAKLNFQMRPMIYFCPYWNKLWDFLSVFHFQNVYSHDMWHLRLSLFEACSINRNHILWKSDSPVSTVLALNNLSCLLFSIRSMHEGNTRKTCEICSKLTIKTPELRQWSLSGVFIVNFEHISHFFLVFLLLTLNKYVLGGRSFIVMLYL